MIKLPVPFRKQGQQIAADGDTKVFCDLFSKEQMRQAIRDAYEDAAKVCEAADDWHPQEVIADAIRKLKEDV